MLFRSSYEDFAIRLKINRLDIAALQTIQIKNRVEETLLQYATIDSPCLLFFDNVDDEEIISELKSLLPSSCQKIKILITSQAGEFYEDNRKIIYIGNGFTTEEAGMFLQSIKDDGNKNELIKTFSSLPLGLAAARIYISDIYISIGEYLILLEEQRHRMELYEDKKMQNFYKKAPGQSSQLAAIRLAINKMNTKSNLARQLLEAAAYLSPVNIPVNLLQDIVSENIGGGSLSLIKVNTNACIGWLTSYSLIKVEGLDEKRVISLHVVTQDAIRFQLALEQRKYNLQIILKILNKYLDNDNNIDQNCWLTPHILIFIRYMEALDLEQDEKSSLLRKIDKHFISTYSTKNVSNENEIAEIITTIKNLLDIKIKCYQTNHHNEVVRTMYVLAYYLEENDQDEKAKDLYNQAKDICIALTLHNRKDGIAHKNYGVAAYNLKDYELALLHFSESIDLDPNYSTAYYNRAMTHIRLGNKLQACDDFSRVIAIMPNHFLAYYNRGLIYYTQRSFEQAKNDFSKVIDLNQTFSLAYRYRSLIYKQEGWLSEAEADELLADTYQVVTDMAKFSPLAWKPIEIVYPSATSRSSQTSLFNPQSSETEESSDAEELVETDKPLTNIHQAAIRRRPISFSNSIERVSPVIRFGRDKYEERIELPSIPSQFFRSDKTFSTETLRKSKKQKNSKENKNSSNVKSSCCILS